MEKEGKTDKIVSDKMLLEERPHFNTEVELLDFSKNPLMALRKKDPKFNQQWERLLRTM